MIIRFFFFEFSAQFYLKPKSYENPYLVCYANWPDVRLPTQRPARSPRPTDDLSIAEAKAWFTNYVASPANARTSADDDFVKNAYWEYAFEHRFSTKNKVVVVPLSHFKRGQTSGFKQLWVYKDKQKKNTLRVVEYFHAESGKGKVLSLKDFTGYMLVKDWDDNFLGGFELKNNNLVGALSKSSKNGRTSGYTCAIGQSCRYVRVGHAEDPSGGYLYLSCITDMVCFWSEVMADNGNNSNSFVVPHDGGASTNLPFNPLTYYKITNNPCDLLTTSRNLNNIEIVGLKLRDGRIVILPAAGNVQNMSWTYSHYNYFYNGNPIMTIFQVNGQTKVDLWKLDGYGNYAGHEGTFDVIEHIHTHPCFANQNLASQYDKDFASSNDVIGPDVALYIMNCNGKIRYNSNGEFRNNSNQPIISAHNCP